MAGNLFLLLVGGWGLYYTWTRRHRSGGDGFFDMASSVRNPWAYAWAVGLRLVIFGAALAAGVYRIVFGITE